MKPFFSVIMYHIESLIHTRARRHDSSLPKRHDSIPLLIDVCQKTSK